jgi:hypothetical protein
MTVPSLGACMFMMLAFSVPTARGHPVLKYSLGLGAREFMKPDNEEIHHMINLEDEDSQLPWWKPAN